MGLPKYSDMYHDLIDILSDGQIHEFQKVGDEIAKRLKLTDKELSMTHASGQNIYRNRVAWTKTYLTKAGLIEIPVRGTVRITQEGLRLHRTGEEITEELLKRYPSFRSFKER